MHLSPTALLAIHSAVTWALVGVVWTVQWVLYPLFAQVGAEAFHTYHSRHMWRISLIVGPLVVLEFVTAAMLVQAGARNPWLLASFVPLISNWLTTLFMLVPHHLRLSRKYDAEILGRLIAGNWWRTIAWSIRGVCLLFASA